MTVAEIHLSDAKAAIAVRRIVTLPSHTFAILRTGQCTNKTWESSNYTLKKHTRDLKEK